MKCMISVSENFLCHNDGYESVGADKLKKLLKTEVVYIDQGIDYRKYKLCLPESTSIEEYKIILSLKYGSSIKII